MADWLASEEIDRIYSSPLQRALQTAAPLSEKTGLEITVEPRIAEFDRDADFYVPLEELKETDYESWRAFMEGGYGETNDLELFRREVVAAIEEIIRENPGRRVVAFCHGGVINVWAVHILEIPRPLFFGPTYTSINRFLGASSGQRSVESLNETPHLRR